MSDTMRPLTLATLLALAAALPAAVAGESAGPWERLEWRNLGPYNMTGRVADVEGVPGDPRVVWVGAAAGGVWKSENGGLGFEPVFDDQPVASIGDLGVAPSNPEVVYVGTGEANVRNSVSPGAGVYKTTDGGKTWSFLGLEHTRHVSRVLVHPADPDTVFVGALGNVFAPHEQRGVFRSTDGGKTWEKVLYLDEHHGVADLDMDPSNPNILYAALWRFERKPWTHRSGSEQGGVWRSVDGGTTWKKLEKGLPKLLGRIGVKVAPSRPETVYVIAESNAGTLFRSDDGGDSFTKVSDEAGIVSRGLYYTDLRVHPTDAETVFAVSSLLQRSIDGGKTFARISRSTHIDFHSLWIDPLDPDRMWQGQDGGVAVTYDGAQTWEPVRNLPLAQFYQVYVDDREPFYYTGGGLQDNGTWYGPSRTREPAGILEDDWRMLSFGDAYWVVPHPDDPEVFLSESQGGAIMRTDMRTRQQWDASPQPRRNDGGPVAPLEYRFNWNAPIVQSGHDPLTVYFAGNVVFRTRDFGESWDVISPDLTTDDPEKQGEAGGPVWYENTTAEYHCTLISFSESPLDASVLWAGSDDGRLHVTRDAGDTWTEVTANLPGVPAHSPISHVEASRATPGTAYVSLDRHMFDDLAPHVFRTQDYGATWVRLGKGLPEAGWLWVLREDPSDADVLYAGTELGLYVSRDAGKGWEPLRLKNLPVTPVHDVVVHRKTGDLVLGTHGRGLWVFDDATPIRQGTPDVLGKPAHLFPVRDAIRFPVRFTRYGLGDKESRAPNPPYGALITYSLGESLEKEPAAGESDEKDTETGEDGEAAGADAAEDTSSEDAEAPRLALEILDASGSAVFTFDQKDLGLEAGLHRVAWSLSHDPPRERKEQDPLEREFAGPRRGPAVVPGTYTARLTLDGVRQETPIRVGVDPLIEASTAELQEQFEMDMTLREMRSVLNDGLRGLDALLSQIQARRDASKALGRDLPKATATALDAAEKDLKELLHSLSRPEDKPRWSLGPRLAENLSSLSSDLNNAYRAPTPPQQELLAQLQAELAEAVPKLDAAFTTRVDALNAALSDEGLAPVTPPETLDAGGS